MVVYALILAQLVVSAGVWGSVLLDIQTGLGHCAWFGTGILLRRLMRTFVIIINATIGVIHNVIYVGLSTIMVHNNVLIAVEVNLDS